MIWRSLGVSAVTSRSPHHLYEKTPLPNAGFFRLRLHFNHATAPFSTIKNEASLNQHPPCPSIQFRLPLNVHYKHHHGMKPFD